MYEEVRSNLVSGSTMKAATDDVVIMIRAEKDHEKDLYEEVNQTLHRLEKEASKVGLTFVNDKAMLLLPRDWSPTHQVEVLNRNLRLRSDTFSNLSVQGMEVVQSICQEDPLQHAEVRSRALEVAPSMCGKASQGLHQCGTQLLDSGVSPTSHDGLVGKV